MEKVNENENIYNAVYSYYIFKRWKEKLEELFLIFS